MRTLGLLDGALGLVDRLARLVAGLSLLTVTFVLFANSFGRYFFNISFVGGEELARILTIWLTFIGAYLVARVNRHVTIDIALRLVSERNYRRLLFVVSTITAVTVAYVAYLGVDLAWRVHTAGQVSAVLPLKRAWFYYPLPLGFGLMALAFAITAAKAALGQIERPPEMMVAVDSGGEAIPDTNTGTERPP